MTRICQKHKKKTTNNNNKNTYNRCVISNNSLHVYFNRFTFIDLTSMSYNFNNFQNMNDDIEMNQGS